MGPTPPTCKRAHQPRAAGSNTPPPSVHSLAAPSPPLSPHFTSSSSATPPHPCLAGRCCLLLLPARGGRDEGHRRVPERPGGRQGRHRPQGIGTCSSLPLPSRRCLLIWVRGAGFHPAGFHGGGFVSSSGFKISWRGLESDCLLGPCVQAKVADLQEAIHARSKWTRLLALIYSTCSHLLQFLYSFCALKCSVLRKKICVFSSCERAWLFAACQSVSAFAEYESV